jgi:hypothetical protein
LSYGGTKSLGLFYFNSFFFTTLSSSFGGRFLGFPILICKFPHINFTLDNFIGDLNVIEGILELLIVLIKTQESGLWSRIFRNFKLAHLPFLIIWLFGDFDVMQSVRGITNGGVAEELHEVLEEHPETSIIIVFSNTSAGDRITIGYSDFL